MIVFSRNKAFTFSMKFRGLCILYYLSEADLTVIQVGPFVAELAW